MSSEKNEDNLFARPLNTITDFVFDEHVAHVFKDMLERSVPGYTAILSMIGVLTEKYARQNTRCYDLGCSLGAATLMMRQHISVPDCSIVGIDNSQAMIAKCQENIEADASTVPVSLECRDIQGAEIAQASVVVMNFVLQFISPDDRAPMVKKIYDGLIEGGICIISEKMYAEDEREEDFHTELYHAFKRMNGYSDLEISQKRTALENVLISDTRQTHIARLRDAGFREVYPWFQCFNFVSMVAIK